MFVRSPANVRFGIYTEDGEFALDTTTDSGCAVSDGLTYGNNYPQEQKAWSLVRANKQQRINALNSQA